MAFMLKAIHAPTKTAVNRKLKVHNPGQGRCGSQDINGPEPVVSGRTEVHRKQLTPNRGA